MHTGLGLTVPYSFKVNEGGGGRVIIVQGSVIRVEPPLGKSRTFSVRDAARLIVHQPKGRSFENVLLDFQGHPLCCFTHVEKNAGVFFQYLQNQGVPLFRPDGQPLETVHPADTAPSVRFTIQLRQTVPVGMWLGLGLFLTLVLFLVGIPVTAMLSGPNVERNLGIMLVLIVLSLIVPWVRVVASGQLFPLSLMVDGEQVRMFRGLRWQELRLEDMDCIRFLRSDECYILYNKQGKPVVKFSTRDDFGPQLMNFLTSHNIRLCSGSERQERN